MSATCRRAKPIITQALLEDLIKGYCIFLIAFSDANLLSFHLDSDLQSSESVLTATRLRLK
jgi:hypothetical protein